MSNPKFGDIDLEGKTCRITKYATIHVLPHLSHETKIIISKMLEVINKTIIFDDLPTDELNLLIASILLYEPSAFHRDHNLDRICVSFGSALFKIIKHYLDLTNFKSITNPNHIAVNLYILWVYAMISCEYMSKPSIHKHMLFIRSLKFYKTMPAYELLSEI